MIKAVKENLNVFVFSYIGMVLSVKHQQCPLRFHQLKVSLKQPLDVFYETGILKNFAKFTRKYLWQSVFEIKLQAVLKKKLWHRCFAVSFAAFLITPFLQNISGWLLLIECFRFPLLIDSCEKILPNIIKKSVVWLLKGSRQYFFKNLHIFL